jgi:hypothetical protein
MLEEMERRPAIRNYPIYQQLAESLKCQESRYLNRRKGDQFTYCYVDPRSKKHILVPPTDINTWKIACGDGLATLNCPPTWLFAKWQERQDRELAKLSDGQDPGSERSGSRYSTGRGAAAGNTTQNVNINLGQLADPAILARLQNSASQVPLNEYSEEPELPQLTPINAPTPIQRGRTRLSRKPTFDLPIRSSSPPQPIAGQDLMDFLGSFDQQYFSRNQSASAGIAKIIQAAEVVGWDLGDLLSQKPAFFQRQGLPLYWLPVIRAEAKRFTSQVAQPGLTADSTDDAVANILAELRSDLPAAQARRDELLAGKYTIKPFPHTSC